MLEAEDVVLVISYNTCTLSEVERERTPNSHTKKIAPSVHLVLLW